MKYVRMPIEIESPEEQGYDTIRFNLSESSMRDRNLSELGLDTNDLVLAYGAHKGAPGLRTLIGRQSNVPEETVLTTAGAAGPALRPATSRAASFCRPPASFSSCSSRAGTRR